MAFSYRGRVYCGDCVTEAIMDRYNNRLVMPEEAPAWWELGDAERLAEIAKQLGLDMPGCSTEDFPEVIPTTPTMRCGCGGCGDLIAVTHGG